MANITYVYDKGNNTYGIREFEKVKKEYEDWLEVNFHPDVLVDNEDTYKAIYAERTTLRKEIDNLKRDNKTIESIIGCKALVSILSEVEEKLTANLDSFKPKDPVYVISFRTKNKDDYDRVIALINEIKEKDNGNKI